MQLSEAQQQLLVRQIEKFWPPPRRCPTCQSTERLEISGIMELRDYHEGNFIVGGGVTPVVILVCSKCGGTQLFNAIKLEVVDRNTGKLMV
jgi:hypothetical protein